MSDDNQPTELDATRLATEPELEPQPVAAPGVQDIELAPASATEPSLAAEALPVAAAPVMLPPMLGNDPPPPPVLEAALVPVHHHRVGGNARHRVHIEGHAGQSAVVRVGRDNPSVDVPKITLPGDVVESIALALVDNDAQRALSLLAPYYAPGEGVADAPRTVTEPWSPSLPQGTPPTAATE